MWILDTPVHSPVEVELRKLLVQLRDDGKLLGIQVCAYKDGKVIIDTAAGFLGENDPRPVQPDSLFSLFSASKGITAGLMHWLVDKRQLKLDDNIANIWPEFASNNKGNIKVHHVLNHNSGLHSALDNIRKENPLLLLNWNESLRQIAQSSPETVPGREQLYHFISFGWLCGGIIEHATGKKFQEILEEALVHPLHIEGEMYIGIPQGVEARLASLTVDANDLRELSALNELPNLPPCFQPKEIARIAAAAPGYYNDPSVRHAIIPAGNAHCSARALARYYACLADRGIIPPLPASSLPPHGSNTHSSPGIKLFNNPEKIHDAFMGLGEYEKFALPGSYFGLGFIRTMSADGSGSAFGHPGLSGSTGFCDINHRFAIAITLNKMTFGNVTPKIVERVCSELNIPFPRRLAGQGLETQNMSIVL